MTIVGAMQTCCRTSKSRKFTLEISLLVVFSTYFIFSVHTDSAEIFYIEYLYIDQHGFSGPITVSRPKYAPGLTEWLEAGKSLDYPIADPNGPQRRSFTPIEFAKKRGRRCSSYKGYIAPVFPFLPNLRIILNTTVTKIVRFISISKKINIYCFQKIPQKEKLSVSYRPFF